MVGHTFQRVICGFMWSSTGLNIIYSFGIILLDRYFIPVDGLSFQNIEYSKY